MGLLSVGEVKRCIMLIEILVSVTALPDWSVFPGGTRHGRPQVQEMREAAHSGSVRLALPDLRQH